MVLGLPFSYFSTISSCFVEQDKNNIDRIANAENENNFLISNDSCFKTAKLVILCDFQKPDKMKHISLSTYIIAVTGQYVVRLSIGCAVAKVLKNKV